MLKYASPRSRLVFRDEVSTEKPSIRVVRKLALRIIGMRPSRPTLLPTEPFLCEELKVSRTVLREAVRTLHAKGLVRVTQGQGMMALPADQWSLLDPEVLNWQCEVGVDEHFVTNLYEVRAIFEPAIAAKAARRATPVDIARIEATYQAMADAMPDAEAYIRADMEFHRAIAASCGNEILAQFSYSIEAALRAGREISIRVPTGWQESCAAHKLVLDAIRDRDPDGAAASILTIVSKAFRDIKEVLAKAKTDVDSSSADGKPLISSSLSEESV